MVTIETAPPVDALETKSRNAHTYGARSDLDGNYRIDNVADGEYYILGQMTGYLSPYDMAVGIAPKGTALSAKAVDAALTRITVAAGKTTTANLMLKRGAVLRGSVHYDDGGPAINLSVALFRQDLNGKWADYSNRVGQSSLSVLGFGAYVDGTGHFYEPGLPAGTYAVRITLPTAELVVKGIQGPRELEGKMTSGNALEVFSGNKYRLKEASPIKLGDGEEEDVEITIPTTELCSIHGTITAKSDGRSLAKANVRLRDPEDNSLLREAETDDDGDFDFLYIVPGNYQVEVNGAEDGVRFKQILAPLLVQNDLAALNYALDAAGR